jgi:hypothetical protein
MDKLHFSPQVLVNRAARPLTGGDADSEYCSRYVLPIYSCDVRSRFFGFAVRRLSLFQAVGTMVRRPRRLMNMSRTMPIGWPHRVPGAVGIRGELMTPFSPVDE